MKLKLNKLSAAIVLAATVGVISGCNNQDQTASISAPIDEDVGTDTVSNDNVLANEPEAKTASMRISLRFPQYEQAQASFIYDNVASYDIKIESVRIPSLDELIDPSTGDYYSDEARQVAELVPFFTDATLTENQVKQALYKDSFRSSFYRVLLGGLPSNYSYSAFGTAYEHTITYQNLGADNAVSVANLTPGLYRVTVIQRDLDGNKLSKTRMLANLGEGQNDVVMTMMDADWKVWDTATDQAAAVSLGLATDTTYDWDPAADGNQPAFNHTSLKFEGITNYATSTQITGPDGNPYYSFYSLRSLWLEADGASNEYKLMWDPYVAIYEGDPANFADLARDEQRGDAEYNASLGADEVQYYDYRIQNGSKTISYLTASLSSDLYYPAGYSDYKATFADSELITQVGQMTLDANTGQWTVASEDTGFDGEHLGFYQTTKDGAYVGVIKVTLESLTLAVDDTSGLDWSKLTVPHTTDGMTMVTTLIEALQQSTPDTSGEQVIQGGEALLSNLEASSSTGLNIPDVAVQEHEQALDVCTTYTVTALKKTVYFYNTQDADGNQVRVILTPKSGVNPNDSGSWTDTNGDGVVALDDAFDEADNYVERQINTTGKVCFHNITLKASALPLNYNGSVTIQ